LFSQWNIHHDWGIDEVNIFDFFCDPLIFSQIQGMILKFWVKLDRYSPLDEDSGLLFRPFPIGHPRPKGQLPPMAKPPAPEKPRDDDIQGGFMGSQLGIQFTKRKKQHPKWRLYCWLCNI